MRIFVTKRFDRFAVAEQISDGQLHEAIMRAESGLIDAQLGGHLIKQRVSRAGGGRSGGYRTIIVFKSATRAIFVFGFAKNARSNISHADLSRLKDLAEFYLSQDEQNLDSAVNVKALREITDAKIDLQE